MFKRLVFKLVSVGMLPAAVIGHLIARGVDVAWWRFQSRRLGRIGENSWASRGFSLVHPECMFIGDGFCCGERVILQTWPLYNGSPTGLAASGSPRLVIGNDVHLVQDVQISCADEINIGDGCLFGGGVFVTDNLHGSVITKEMDIPPGDRPLSSKGSVHIGKNVWLGRNVCVMPGVTIGDGAIVGANAVVTHNIPAHSVAAGVPARIIR